MFIGSALSFIYRNKGSELAYSLFKSGDCLDALDLQSDYLIGEAVFGGCWIGFALWDE